MPPASKAAARTAGLNWANAEAAYKKSIEVKPDDAAAYVGLAGIYFNTGKTTDAKPLVENHLAYNQPIHSVADGVVTDVWPVTPRGPGRLLSAS